jgi:hypothetical protein
MCVDIAAPSAQSGVMLGGTNQLPLTRAARYSGRAQPHSSQPRRLLRSGGAKAALAVWLFLCSVGPARAFNGWEHETLSQLSLLLASNQVSIAFCDSTNTADRLTGMREVVSSFHSGLPEAAEWRKPGSIPITFGEITMLVDYMKDSYDMLHLPHSRVNLPTDARTCNLPYLRSLIEHGGKVISLASASHEAYNHFQSRGLDAFCFSHKLAVEAATRTNLWGALLLSAYSLHFLEDFFAPGHLLTPRDANAHDLDVAMLHDYFNDLGLIYLIRAPEQLVPLADTARAFLSSSPGPWRSCDGKPKHALCFTNGAFDQFCRRLSAESCVDVFCYGDDKINASKLQAPLVLSCCTRAVADVLESYVRGVPTNSFPTYVWDRRNLGGMQGLEAIFVRLPYGELSCSNGFSSLTVALEVQKLALRDPSVTNFDVVTSLTRPVYRNPGIAFTVGFESVSDFEASRVRGLLEAEALVTGGRRDISSGTEQFKRRGFPRNLMPRNWGLTLGYSGVYGTDDQGQGAFGRLVWPIPSVNLQISAQVGGRYYWGEGVQGFRDFEMLRADWGVHLLTIFVAAGHDYYTFAHGDLHSGLAFEAGISIALPYSKIKNLGKLTE